MDNKIIEAYKKKIEIMYMTDCIKSYRITIDYVDDCYRYFEVRKGDLTGYIYFNSFQEDLELFLTKMETAFNMGRIEVKQEGSHWGWVNFSCSCGNEKPRCSAFLRGIFNYSTVCDCCGASRSFDICYLKTLIDIDENEEVAF